jgi:hypothetical protein
VQDVFRGILSGLVLGSTVTLKVVDEFVRVLADLVKVDGLSTLGQEEQSVETFEQHGGRLVDSAQDGLTMVRKLFEEIQNVPRGLRVQTRSRLVEEKQQLGLGDQFDSNSETLSLFDVETYAPIEETS